MLGNCFSVTSASSSSVLSVFRETLTEEIGAPIFLGDPGEAWR